MPAPAPALVQSAHAGMRELEPPIAAAVTVAVAPSASAKRRPARIRVEEAFGKNLVVIRLEQLLRGGAAIGALWRVAKLHTVDELEHKQRLEREQIVDGGHGETIKPGEHLLPSA